MLAMSDGVADMSFIPQSEIAKHCNELGGTHTYDLTPEVTHLVVGEYDTPKYRHVAKERPDIVCVAPGWVEAVRDLWVEDSEIDFEAIEAAWRLRALESGGLVEAALSPNDSDDIKDAEGSGGKERDPNKTKTRLLICLTGFDDVDERQEIVDTIRANGGEYTGDLTKYVTHLIAARPEGKKYEAARDWGNVFVVGVEWLYHSVQRGLILDEKAYDPLKPVEKRGAGAWTVRLDVEKGGRGTMLGKRARDAAIVQERRSKMRRTTSERLSSQMGSIWGGIAAKDASGASGVSGGQSGRTESSSDEMTRRHQPGASESMSGNRGLSMASGKSIGEEVSGAIPSEAVGPVFASCLFFVHGFSAEQHAVVANAIHSLGGSVCGSMEEVSSEDYDPPPLYRFLLVPQTSQPETHPLLVGNVEIVTEFYIERCLHKKAFIDPDEHILGRPFPAFPIEGFERLSICTSGFTNIDLNQVDKAVRQLGARYEESFTQKASVLVCTSLADVRKAKLDMALRWGTPVVSQEWLWSCIRSAYKAPVGDHLFKELRQKIRAEPGEERRRAPSRENGEKEKIDPSPFEQTAAPRPAKARSRIRDIDMLAFEQEGPLPPLRARAKAQDRRPQVLLEESMDAPFKTAPERQTPGYGSKSATSNSNPESNRSAPLSERSASSLNRGSRSPEKQVADSVSEMAQLKNKQSRVLKRVTSVADSEAPDDSQAPPILTLAMEESESASAAMADETTEGPEDLEAAAEAARLEEIRLKKEARDAERAALAEKITSLMHTRSVSKAETDEGSAAEGEPYAGADSPSKRAAAPTRRKRGILGRAVSNVSAASSVGSADSTPADPVISLKAAGKRRTLSAMRADSIAASDSPSLQGVELYGLSGALLADGTGVEESDKQPPPPPTQLGFRDPAADEGRKVLMNKMMTRSKASLRSVSDPVGSTAKGGKGKGMEGKGIEKGEVDMDTPSRRTRSRA
jgi:DNA replication regulator DPB11